MDKAISYIFLIILINCNSSKAQFEKDNYALSFGYGYPNFQRISVWFLPDKLNYKATDVGPLHIKASYFITNKIEVSLNVNYANFKGVWQKQDNGVYYNYRYEGNGVAGLLRANIHQKLGTNIDGYWGCAVGGGNLRRYSFTDNPNDESFNKNCNLTVKSFETTIGMRCYLSKNIGVYAELGYAKSILQAGIILKFNNN